MGPISLKSYILKRPQNNVFAFRLFVYIWQYIIPFLGSRLKTIERLRKRLGVLHHFPVAVAVAWKNECYLKIDRPLKHSSILADFRALLEN